MLASLETLLAGISPTQWAVLGGVLAALLSSLLVVPALKVCEARPRFWPAITGSLGLVLGAALSYVMVVWQCQVTPVVHPDDFHFDLRIVFHIVCLSLLLVITTTDLVTLYIPNFVVYLGIVIGLSLATLSGQLQIEHVWVDWNEEVPQLSGPYIPEWLKHSQHWHGLAWSSAGALVGAALTAIIRKVAQLVLGRPAMGAGDVTLMAMIGAFLGWQPTVIAFFLAPILALALGPLARRISAEKAVPYGPFLALGAILVMFTWRWIWMFEVDIGLTEVAGPDDRATSFAVRRMFGDWVLLLGLALIAIGGTAGLMGLIRVFWSIPLERESKDVIEAEAVAPLPVDTPDSHEFPDR